MEWYRVTKTIKGRKYDYWQKTYRAGGSVKTLNKYIGPSQTTLRGQPIPGWRTMTKAQRYNVKMDRMFHDAQILNRRYDALRKVTKTKEVSGTFTCPTCGKDNLSSYCAECDRPIASSDNPEPGNPEGEEDDLHGATSHNLPFGLEKGLYFCTRCETQTDAVDWEGKCYACEPSESNKPSRPLPPGAGTFIHPKK